VGLAVFVHQLTSDFPFSFGQVGIAKICRTFFKMKKKKEVKITANGEFTHFYPDYLQATLRIHY